MAGRNKGQRLQLWADPTLVAAVERAAKRSGKNMSVVIRDAMRAVVAEGPGIDTVIARNDNGVWNVHLLSLEHREDYGNVGAIVDGLSELVGPKAPLDLSIETPDGLIDAGPTKVEDLARVLRLNVQGAL